MSDVRQQAENQLRTHRQTELAQAAQTSLGAECVRESGALFCLLKEFFYTPQASSKLKILRFLYNEIKGALVKAKPFFVFTYLWLFN